MSIDQKLALVRLALDQISYKLERARHIIEELEAGRKPVSGWSLAVAAQRDEEVPF